VKNVRAAVVAAAVAVVNTAVVAAAVAVIAINPAV